MEQEIRSCLFTSITLTLSGLRKKGDESVLSYYLKKATSDLVNGHEPRTYGGVCGDAPVDLQVHRCVSPLAVVSFNHLEIL